MVFIFKNATVKSLIICWFYTLSYIFSEDLPITVKQPKYLDINIEGILVAFVTSQRPYFQTYVLFFYFFDKMKRNEGFCGDFWLKFFRFQNLVWFRAVINQKWISWQKATNAIIAHPMFVQPRNLNQCHWNYSIKVIQLPYLLKPSNYFMSHSYSFNQ